MPSGNVDKPMIEDNRDGTVSVRYEPREEGLHELHVKYNGEHVSGRFKAHVLRESKTILTLTLFFRLASPFKFYCDSISSGAVTGKSMSMTFFRNGHCNANYFHIHIQAYGPGLTHGVSGEPCNFTISTKGAGAGGLSLAVEGPSKAEISCHDNKDGTVSVTYLPTAPGEYKISVKFGDKNIKGSPFTSKITGNSSHLIEYFNSN